MTDVNLFVVEKHAVNGLDCILRGFIGLVVNEAVAFRTSLLIGSNLAGKYIAESGESIVKSLGRNE